MSIVTIIILIVLGTVNSIFFVNGIDLIDFRHKKNKMKKETLENILSSQIESNSNKISNSSGLKRQELHQKNIVCNSLLDKPMIFDEEEEEWIEGKSFNAESVFNFISILLTILFITVVIVAVLYLSYIKFYS